MFVSLDISQQKYIGIVKFGITIVFFTRFLFFLFVSPSLANNVETDRQRQ